MTDLAANVVLLRPWWLLALPLIAVASLIALRRARGLGAWERAMDPPMLAAMERFGRVVPGGGRRVVVPALLAALVALGLSSPARRIAAPDTFRNLDGIVLAVDLSRSIVEGGGLDDAQAAAQSVLQGAAGRPVAMIVYAGDAYVASAFTTDALALSPVLATLDGKTVPNPGSRTDRALELAERMFGEAGILRGDVVVVTDGDGLPPSAYASAETLAAAGIHVNAFLVQPNAGAPDMPPADEPALRRLVDIGDGSFAEARDPMPLADAIGRRQASEMARGDAAALFFRDLGRALLIPALFPALLLFRRAI